MLLLGQRDRNFASEGLVLPAVVGVLVELDVDEVRLGLAGLDRAKVPAAGQLGDRSQYRLRTDVVRVDADRELAVVDVCRRRAVAEVAADRAGRVDASGVGDVELQRLRLARLQVVEGQVDRTAVVVVADAEAQRCRVDVDARRLGVGEGCARGHDRSDDGDTEDGGSGGCGDGALGAGSEGHDDPYLQQKLRRVFLKWVCTSGWTLCLS